ncbi:hypothetical protein [Leptothoe sp. PORK10 BA2]|uniref:hypothetical protein n=1 Tax=Leptothoe sp. PORK10 BA2 TaxID=3110254 RepID=UPI002B1FE4E6|nr:hypothetical protein [Leptothoe sp. PORK10 BA2]MEA5465172.1 hypothetical protein [Leptothoe sp. PORK10 BA2]
MPPSVQPTAEDPKPQFGWLSKRRLLFLIATAATASGLGMALGGTLRFQVVSVGQAPLFKPQQDFPPLAEWPPEVPSAEELDHLEPSSDDATPPQLVYNERPTREIERNDVEEPGYAPEDSSDSDGLTPTDSIDPTTSRTDSSTESTPENLADEGFDPDALPPVSSTQRGNLDHGPIDDGPPGEVDDLPRNGNEPQFNKQPASESQFNEAPDIEVP